MQQFTDSTQQIWQVQMKVGLLEKIKAGLDVDMLTIVDGTLLDKLSLNPPLIVSALWICCREQANERGITPEQFAEGIDETVIDSALSALLGSLIDFFPRDKRELLRKTIAKLEQAQEQTLELLDSPEMDTAIRNLIKEHGAKAFKQVPNAGKSYGNVPAS